MARITDATTTWSTPVTLSTDEIWQARAGTIYLTTTSVPAADDGVLLEERSAVILSAGSNVSYRQDGTAATVIIREAI